MNIQKNSLEQSCHLEGNKVLHVNEQIHFVCVREEHFCKVKDFILKECKSHYGTRIFAQRYEELEAKLTHEIRDENNAFYACFNQKNEVVGSISICRYDNRIASLQEYYKQDNVAEVGRCYVLDSYRRRGIGSSLFDLAKHFASQRGYEVLYLHTHYFLPGGFSFWQNMGFEITFDEGGDWQTVHMERLVREIQYSFAV